MWSVKANLGRGNAADGIYLVTELEDDRGVLLPLQNQQIHSFCASTSNGP